tara:strand:- start:4062 stop:4328 length:267 start_codon:yes stop_codon:yes gene_type:complete
MNTSKAVLVFVSIYFIQWVTLSGIVTFASGMLFKEAIVTTPVGAFMILFGWIIPCIVALDYQEWANKKTKQIQIDKEWERTNNQWSNI